MTKQKIKIYKINVDQAYVASSEQGTHYSLRPWGKNTPYYQGDDDGGRDYVLPPGYELSTTQYGEPAIYDSTGAYCDIVVHNSGRPQLSTAGKEMPVLSLA